MAFSSNLLEVVSVTVGAGGTASFNHTLNLQNQALLPNIIQPTLASPLVVTTATTATFTVNNPDVVNAHTADFVVEYEHSIQRDAAESPLPTLYWQGIDSTGLSAATTLQGAYDGGTAGIQQVIVLGTGGRLGVAIRDAAVAIVGDLFEVTDNGDLVQYFGVNTVGITTSGAVTLLDSAAAVSPANAIRFRSSAGVAQVSQSGAAYVNILTAGSVTLQVAYAAGGAGMQVITEGAAGGLGIAFRDAAAPIAGNLFEVTNNGDTLEFLGVSTAGMTSQVAVRLANTAGTLEWSTSVAAATATQTVADTTFNHAFTQTTAAATGAHVFMTITPGVNTNQTLSTEIPEISVALASKEWATGALVNQRFVRITSPTVAFVGASTVTRAATLYAAQPLIGANATLTSSVAAWFENNTAQTATNADAILLTHQTSGTPAIGFGSGIQWQLPDSAGTLFAQGRIQCDLTAATAANPTSEFTFFTRASGGLASAMTLSSIALIHPAVIRADGSLRQGSSNQLIIATAAGQTSYTLAGGVANSGLFTYSGANSTSTNAWIFRNCTRTALTSEAIMMDFDAATNTMTFAAGTFALQRINYFRGAVLVGTAAGSTITSLVQSQFDTPTASGANITYTAVAVTALGSSAVIGPSGTTTTYSVEQLAAHTITYTVATGSTAACGVAGIRINQITVAQNTGAGTLTVSQAASLYISAAPVAGTGSAITNAYAIFVDAGLSRFDGNGTHVFEVPADATGNITVATGRIPILTGGALKYLRYFDD